MVAFVGPVTFSNTEVLVCEYTERCMFCNTTEPYYRYCLCSIAATYKAAQAKITVEDQFKKLNASCKCCVYTAYTPCMYIHAYVLY